MLRTGYRVDEISVLRTTCLRKFGEKFALSVRTPKIWGEFALSVRTVSVAWVLLVQKRSEKNLSFFYVRGFLSRNDKSTSSPYVVDGTVLYRAAKKKFTYGTRNASHEGGHVQGKKTPSSLSEIKNRTKIKLN